MLKPDDARAAGLPEEVLTGAAAEAALPAAGSEPPPSRVPDDSRTDVGNARLFATLHRADLRHAAALGWLAWDGRRWAPDGSGVQVTARAKQTARAILVAAADLPDAESREVATRHALTTHSRTRLEAMIALAVSEPGIEADPAAFDADPMLFNCLNGTIDLRTLQRRPHRREDLLSKLAPVEFDPDATCPTWERFLSDVMDGNERLTAYLQRLAGYTLTGRTSEHVLGILYGTGRNGKSTFLDTLAFMLGDYFAKADAETFMESKRGATGPRDDLAELAGARLVTAIEVGNGRHFAEAMVKEVTGGDVVRARHLYKAAFRFVPAFKLLIAANHRPRISGTDAGIWSRVHLIPFQVFIPPERRDKDLSAKLRDELPGILAWAARGCLIWQRDGLQPPREVLDATALYRSEMDPLSGFFAERCEVGRGLSAPFRDLYEAYKAWAAGEGEEPLTQRQFGGRLSERGMLPAKVGHDGAKWRSGVALRSPGAIGTAGRSAEDRPAPIQLHSREVDPDSGCLAGRAGPVFQESPPFPTRSTILLEKTARTAREDDISRVCVGNDEGIDAGRSSEIGPQSGKAPAAPDFPDLDALALPGGAP